MRGRTVRHLHAGYADGLGSTSGAQPSPRMAEVREALAGNLCRCTGFMRIFDSVHFAAAMLKDEKDLAETHYAR